MADTDIRLTSLAHGGGCGCKLAPAVLQQILADSPTAGPFANLLVGTETSDDAAAWRLNDSQVLVATTDFFMPVVDDPFDFGRIAATNAISDVYAMGATPIMALAIVGMPLGKISIESVRAILSGGAAVCAAAGIPVAGGHSIDSPEPIYGLVAMGLVHPDRLMRNSAARAGDRLILTKGLGVGVFSAALKQGRLDAACYETMINSTTQLNAVGARLPQIEGVHSVTDVTGFGLLGHALEMCRGAALTATLRTKAVPLLPGAAELAQAGLRTGAATRNWASYGEAVQLSPELAEWQRDLLCDPQTSGGLLIAAAPEVADAVLDLVRRDGFNRAAIVGEFSAGPAGINVI
jgi:selenide, water dikinase